MKMLKKMIVAMVLVGSVFAGNAMAYNGWSGIQKITSIRTYSNGTVLVQMENMNNPGNCNNGNTPDYYSLSVDDSNHRKLMYSSILTAYTSEKNVDFALTGCAGTFPKIEQVFLR